MRWHLSINVSLILSYIRTWAVEEIQQDFYLFTSIITLLNSIAHKYLEKLLQILNLRIS